MTRRLPALPPVARRNTGGRPRADDPRSVVVAARRAQAGLTPDTDPQVIAARAEAEKAAERAAEAKGGRQATRALAEAVSAATEALRGADGRLSAEALAPWYGEPVGRCIAACLGPDERPRVWSVWTALCAAERTYAARILSSRPPVAALLTVLPDRHEAGPDTQHDTRTAEERDRDAVNGWMRWRGWLGHLGAGEQSAILAAVRDDGPELWRDGAPTLHGRKLAALLARLAEVTETTRGRHNR